MHPLLNYQIECSTMVNCEKNKKWEKKKKKGSSMHHYTYSSKPSIG